MRHVTLLEELEAYRPWNDQEERDRAELLRRLRSGEALYTRDNAAGHLTASAWVVSPDLTQVLMAYHNLYDSWSVKYTFRMVEPSPATVTVSPYPAILFPIKLL